MVAVRIERLHIDLVRRKVLVDDKPLKLTDLSYRFLLALVDAGGEPVSIKALTKRAWPQQVSGDAVKQQARTLRLALEPDPANPRYIESVRGFGYRIAGDIELIHDYPTSPSTRRRWLMTAGPALALLTIPALWLRASKPEVRPLRLAVPAISPIGEGNWTTDLAAGLDAELSAALIKLDGLHLVSDLGGMRSSNFMAATASEQFQVDLALTGAVRFDQDRSRVVFELVNCSSGNVIAVRAFDLPLGLDVTAQSQLAAEVAVFVSSQLELS